jgi:hypothetical protein
MSLHSFFELKTGLVSHFSTKEQSDPEILALIISPIFETPLSENKVDCTKNPAPNNKTALKIAIVVKNPR